MKNDKLSDNENEVTQQLFEEGNSSEKQLTLLAEISQNFSNSLDISQTLQNAIERFMQYLNSEAASIFLLENNNSELVCVRCAGPVDITGIKIPSDKGIIGNAINLRKSQMIRDAQNDPNFSKLVDAGTGFETRSILAVPIVDATGPSELIEPLLGLRTLHARRHILPAAEALPPSSARRRPPPPLRSLH